MASTIAVVIFLVVAASFCSSSVRTYPAPSYLINPDNDYNVGGEDRKPAENTKDCDSIPEGDKISRKNESKVKDSVGPGHAMIDDSKRNSLTEENFMLNEVATSGSGTSEKCDDFRIIVHSPTFLTESEVLGIHNKMCQKLKYPRCYLGDIISFEDHIHNRRFSVTVSGGQLFGLSQFFASYSLMENDLNMFLRWKNLELHFNLKTDEREKEDVRSIEARIPRLYMYVHLSNLNLKKVEISQVPKQEVEFKNLDSLSSVEERAYENSANHVVEFINKNLRNFILYRVMESLDFNSNDSESTTPFCI